MKNIIVAMVVAGLVAQGCATVFKGTKSEVNFNSQPEGARLLVNGVERGATPSRLPLDSGKNHHVRFMKDGYREEAVYLQGEVEAVWVILDIFPGILLGVIPVLVDAITGAWNEIEPEAVSVTLAPAAVPPASPLPTVNRNQ